MSSCTAGLFIFNNDDVRLQPIEVCYIKKIDYHADYRVMAEILENHLNCSFQSTYAFLKGELKELPVPHTEACLQATVFLGAATSFTVKSKLPANFTARLPRHFDTIKVSKAPPCVQVIHRDIQVDIGREICSTYALYGDTSIVNTSTDEIEIEVTASWWPMSIRRPVNLPASVCHDGYLYQNLIMCGRVEDFRECMQVWRKPKMRKYFDRWRKFVRVSRSSRLKDVNDEFHYTSQGPASKVNQYGAVFKSFNHLVTQQSSHR